MQHTTSLSLSSAELHSVSGARFGRCSIVLLWLVYGTAFNHGLEVRSLWLLHNSSTYTNPGECVTLMIRSIWTSYNDVPNSLPVSSGTNTRDFVSFFLFWVCSLPAIWFPVHKIRHLFTAKAFFVPPAGVAFFIWAIVRAHGIGPIVHQSGTASGSKLGWAIVQGIMSSIANFATLIVNDPDFARFARKPRDALWSQLITIPVGFAVTSFIGIIVSSSSAVIYGEPIWNPLNLLSYFLINPNTGKTANGPARFGVFIISFAFALAQLGTNIAANSVSAGTDMTALLPRYLNIRRGGYICAAVGLAMCPWYVSRSKSSNHFLTHLIQEPPLHIQQLHNLPIRLLRLPFLHRWRHHLRLLHRPPRLLPNPRPLFRPQGLSLLLRLRLPLARLHRLYLRYTHQYCWLRWRYWETGS